MATILLIALGIRLFGINHGLPYGYQIDEKFVINHAIGFGTGDFNPHAFHWPGPSLMYLIFLNTVYCLLQDGYLVFSNPLQILPNFLCFTLLSST